MGGGLSARLHASSPAIGAGHRSISPDQLPPIGTVIGQAGMLGPQRYELVAYRPAKGRRPVAIFRSHCAACGKPFECDNSKAGGASPRYLSRRCPACRRDSKQAKDGKQRGAAT